MPCSRDDPLATPAAGGPPEPDEVRPRARDRTGRDSNINTKTYKGYSIAGASSVTATAVNNLNDFAGFETRNGKVVSFLQESTGKLITLSVPGADATTALGLNDGDQVVGAYTVGNQSFGFAWTPGVGFQTINDPNGVGSTTIKGLNDRGQLVGFYTDGAGNTDGLLATP